MLICWKPAFPPRRHVNVGTAIPVLNVQPVGLITPPLLTVMLRPPLLKVVPSAFRVPATTICPWPPPKPLPGNDTVSPVSKESIPLSVSVLPDEIWTVAFALTAIETPDPTVIGPPKVEYLRRY